MTQGSSGIVEAGVVDLGARSSRRGAEKPRLASERPTSQTPSETKTAMNLICAFYAFALGFV
jgi:hypothetical protein